MSFSFDFQSFQWNVCAYFKRFARTIPFLMDLVSFIEIRIFHSKPLRPALLTVRRADSPGIQGIPPVRLEVEGGLPEGNFFFVFSVILVVFGLSFRVFPDEASVFCDGEEAAVAVDSESEVFSEFHYGSELNRP